jgi:hypothetical protein
VCLLPIKLSVTADETDFKTRSALICIILVYEGFEPIDVWGFAEAFTISRFLGTGYLGAPAYPFEFCLSPMSLDRQAKKMLFRARSSL